MTRDGGLSIFPANFEPQVAAPLDARDVVDLYEDLSRRETWVSTDGNVYTYVGMKVTVKADPHGPNNGLYWLVKEDWSIPGNWQKIAASDYIVSDVLVNDKTVVLDTVARIDLTGQLDKTDEPNVVYGTDDQGNQITIPIDQFGQVDDVLVDGVSVVTDKIAEIDLTGKADVEVVNTISQIVSGHTQDIKDINNEAVLLEQRVTTNEFDIENLQTDLSTLTTQVSGHDVDITLLGNRITGTETHIVYLQNDVSTLTTQVSGHEIKISDLIDQVITNTSNIEDLRTDLTITENNVTTLTDKVSGQRIDLELLENRVDQTEIDIVDLQHEISTTQNNLSTLTDKVSGHDIDISNLTNRVTSTELDITGLQSDVTTINENVSGLTIRTTNTELDVVTLTNRVSETETEISTLQDGVSGIQISLTDHIDDTDNPHIVTAIQLDLGNVDNTSDLDKPISTATQAALDLKVDRTNLSHRLYGTDSAGNQAPQTWSISADNGTVAMRTSTGQINATDPVDSTNLTTKNYVDTSISDAISPIETDISSLLTDVTTLQNDQITGINSDFGVTHTITLTRQNSVPLSTVVDIANETHDGLMPKESFTAINDLEDRVHSLESGGIWRATFPTYAALIATYPGLDVSSTTWTVNDFVDVEADENKDPVKQPSTEYIVTGTNGGTRVLQFWRITNVPIPIATNTSLGVVKGDATGTPGKSTVENDGTLTVQGWDELSLKADNAQPQIQAGTTNRVMLFSGTAGTVNSTAGTLAIVGGIEKTGNANGVLEINQTTSARRTILLNQDLTVFSASQLGSNASPGTGGVTVRSDATTATTIVGPGGGTTNLVAGTMQTQIPASTTGFLATHSGTVGTFGTPVDTTTWQKTQIGGGTNNTVILNSGTAGTVNATTGTLALAGNLNLATAGAFQINGHGVSARTLNMGNANLNVGASGFQGAVTIRSAGNLATTIIGPNNAITTLVEGTMQTEVPAGTAGQILTNSGTAGTFGTSIPVTSTIGAAPNTSTSIPTEAAVRAAVDSATPNIGGGTANTAILNSGTNGTVNSTVGTLSLQGNFIKGGTGPLTISSGAGERHLTFLGGNLVVGDGTASGGVTVRSSSTQATTIIGPGNGTATLLNGTHQLQVPAGTAGHLITNSGTAGTFGTSIDASGWQQSQVPAGSTTSVLLGSGTAGIFGAFRNITTTVGAEITGTALPTEGAVRSAINNAAPNIGGGTANTVILNSGTTGTVNSTAGTLQLDGNLIKTGTGSLTLTTDGANNRTFNLTGNLTKGGTGTLTLTLGATARTLNMTNAGLQVGADSARTGTIVLSSDNTTQRNLQLGGNLTTQNNGLTIDVQGANRTLIISANTTLNGTPQAQIAAGTANQAMLFSGTAGTVNATTGTLAIDGGINKTGTGILTLTTDGANNRTFNLTGGLTKTGTGTLTLTTDGANNRTVTFNGNFTKGGAGAGTFETGANARTLNLTNAALTVGSAAANSGTVTIESDGSTARTLTLAGNVTLSGTPQPQIGAGTANQAMLWSGTAGTINATAGTLAIAGGISKTGTGVLTLATDGANARTLTLNGGFTKEGAGTATFETGANNRTLNLTNAALTVGASNTQTGTITLTSNDANNRTLTLGGNLIKGGAGAVTIETGANTRTLNFQAATLTVGVPNDAGGTGGTVTIRSSGASSTNTTIIGPEGGTATLINGTHQAQIASGTANRVLLRSATAGSVGETTGTLGIAGGSVNFNNSLNLTITGTASMTRTIDLIAGLTVGTSTGGTGGTVTVRQTNGGQNTTIVGPDAGTATLLNGTHQLQIANNISGEGTTGAPVLLRPSTSGTVRATTGNLAIPSSSTTLTVGNTTQTGNVTIRSSGTSGTTFVGPNNGTATFTGSGTYWHNQSGVSGQLTFSLSGTELTITTA